MSTGRIGRFVFGEMGTREQLVSLPEGAVIEFDAVDSGTPTTGTQRPPCPRIAAAVLGACWMIEEDKLLAIAEFIQARAVLGRKIERREKQDSGGDGSPAAAVKTAVRQGSIAVLPLTGTIVPRADFLTEISGGTNLAKWMTGFRAAVADPNVGGILIDIASPGGSVFGVDEAASEIRAARSQKPVVAIANHYAYSAAYYLGSQASELVVSPSGQVGSLGVLSIHEDQSGLNEMLGLKYTIIRSVPGKADANPMEPLSDSAQANMQSQVDAYHAMFVNAVAAGRRVSAQKVNADFGQGRTVMASAAVKRGMADRVDTFQNTLQRMVGGNSAAGSSKAEQLIDEHAEAVEQLEEATRAAVEAVEALDPVQLDQLEEAVGPKFNVALERARLELEALR